MAQNPLDARNVAGRAPVEAGVNVSFNRGIGEGGAVGTLACVLGLALLLGNGRFICVGTSLCKLLGSISAFVFVTESGPSSFVGTSLCKVVGGADEMVEEFDLKGLGACEGTGTNVGSFCCVGISRIGKQPSKLRRVVAVAGSLSITCSVTGWENHCNRPCTKCPLVVDSWYQSGLVRALTMCDCGSVLLGTTTWLTGNCPQS